MKAAFATSPLRRAIRLSYASAMLWAGGNALSSGLLLIYWARDLDASYFQLGLLQAAPALVGLLRLGTPALIAWLGSSKRVCLGFSVVAYALLALVPPLVMSGEASDSASSVWSPLILLLALLCVHQVVEQIATVALFSWLGDLVPRRVRGRYFARRNILQLSVLIPTFLASGWAIDTLRNRYPEPRGWVYAAAVALGAGLLLAALVPLAFMPARMREATRLRRSAPPQTSLWATFAAPFRDVASRKLLLYGCWFSLFNGLFSTPQNIFPKVGLGLGLGPMNAMQTVMRLGQVGVSAWAGPWSDRRGNRPVIVLCQLLVGTAPLFYLAASPSRPYWILGAWLLWSAYAGINICVPNLTMKLAPAGGHAPHLAAYYALTSLFLTVGTVGGGYVFDLLRDRALHLFQWPIDRFALFFALAWLTRTAAALLIAQVPEPGAERWSEIVQARGLR